VQDRIDERLPKISFERIMLHFVDSDGDMSRQNGWSFTTKTGMMLGLGEEEHERIIGTSSYYLDPSTRLAEVAYLVDTDYQRQGLGQALHARTIQYAAAHGIRGFTADVLGENHAMIAVFTRGPGKLEMKTRYGVTEIVLEFTALDEANAELAMV